MRYCFLLILGLVPLNSVLAQSKIHISRPVPEFSSPWLTIKYDITGCGTGQYVDIYLTIVNSKGDTLRPVTVNGDFGPRIACGAGKEIKWNVVRDNIILDDDLEISVVAKETDPLVNAGNLNTAHRITRGKVMAASILVPGLGQKLASGRNGHLVFTGIVYGCAGASVLFYVKHKQYYSDYKNATGSEGDILFEKSEKNFNLSRYSMYAAAGTWLANFIWSAAIPIRDPRNPRPEISLSSGKGKELLISASLKF